jgi:hypothetical protein
VTVAVAGVGIENAGAVLQARAVVREAPVTAVCRALLREVFPDVPGAISAKRQAQLEAACRRIDHYSGAGEWIRFACVALAGWAAGEYQWLTEPPRSLGALALELRREANMRRYGALSRRGERLRPLAAARERAQAKRGRAERRQLEREYGRLAVRKRRP